MNIVDLLKKKSEEILDEATEHLQQRRMAHYELRDAVWIRRKVNALFEVVLQTLQTGRNSAISKYATMIAAERFSSGFGLREVEVAFNALEECIWTRILQEMKPTEVPSAVSSLGSVLKKGKDSVALTYFALIAEMSASVVKPPLAL